jgi:hypothetical protein
VRGAGQEQEGHAEAEQGNAHGSTHTRVAVTGTTNL